MLIFEDHSWQTSTESREQNYLAGMDTMQPKWVVSDDSEIARKVMCAQDQWEPVEDGEGNLIDITAVPYVPTREELALVRAEEIKAELAEIDSQAVRPLRAIVAGTATDDDRARLAELEARADALRAELDKPEVS